MIANRKFGIGTLLLALLLISMVFVPAASADVISSSDEEVSVDEGISYTDTELQNLYFKYNINENEIKFAKNELPNFLEGTILFSDKRIIVTEDGNPPKNMKIGENYDVIMCEQELKNIMENAIQKYIDTYNVDPSNSKVEIVGDYVLPKEEVKKLVESGKLSAEDQQASTESDNSLINIGTFTTTFTHIQRNPCQINGEIIVNIFVAKEDSFTHQAPTEAYYQDTVDALERFENSGVSMIRIWHYNFWDVSDVSPYTSSDNLLEDLEEDTTWVIDDQSEIVLGWVDSMNNNGIAWRPGSFGVCAVRAVLGVNWPHDSIVQHEVSHNFGAEDQNSVSHPECIMNYAWAYDGTNKWCTSCWNTVNYGIYN